MLYLSLGENCLCQDIINRNGLNTFNTIYSYARSNIDYASYLESINYYKFLDRDSLKLAPMDGGCYFLKLTEYCDDMFIYKYGFEFTHHDIVTNTNHYNSFVRKIFRMDRVRYNEDMCFFYHHRANKLSDVLKLKYKMSDFERFYKRNNKVYFVLMYQSIVNSKEKRKVEIKIDNNIFECCFCTLAMWAGNDPKIFWAKNDDALIKKAIGFIRSQIEIKGRAD